MRALGLRGKDEVLGVPAENRGARRCHCLELGLLRFKVLHFCVFVGGCEDRVMYLSSQPPYSRPEVPALDAKN